MMRVWILALFCLPFIAQAQDFTRERADDKTSTNKGVGAEMLVLPFHPHYFISEVDRMMCPPTMDVSTFRDKLRASAVRELVQAFSDSLNVIDLSMQIYEEAIDIEEYMYNAMDYEYVEMKEEEEKKKRFDIGLPVRKEEKVYGAKARKKNGQLDREEILHDRFMMANVINEGAVEYLQELYPFEHFLVLSQLEIRRQLDDPAAGDYVCSMHLTLLDDKGVAKDGYKEVMNLNASQMNLSSFKQEVLPAMAGQVLVNFWPKIQSKPFNSPDNTDY